VCVHGLSVSSSHYAPFGNNRTEVNQTLLKFYFCNSCKVDQDSDCIFIDDFDRTFVHFFCFLFYSSSKNFLSQKELVIYT
jgi:hypothetical protein